MKNCKKCGNEEVLQNGLCSVCIGIKAHFKKIQTSINNAEHPARKKAIEIMEYIIEYTGEADMFDCKETEPTWYDVEDKLTNIIASKE